MKSVILKQEKSTLLILFIGILFISILIAVPTGYEDALIYQGMERATGRVIETDNSAIKKSGLIQSGEQNCTMVIENGKFKGKELTGVNFLSGSLEKDKIYKVGEKALVTISCN